MWCCSDPLSTLARHPGASRDPVFLLFVFVLIASVVGGAFALTRESLFFVWPKKSDQKKGHPGGAPSALRATGAQAGSEFSEGTSLRRPKTTRILRAALRVLPILLAAPQGPRTSKRGSNSKARIKIKGIPPRSSPALRAREKAESNSNSGLHRVLEGLNNCRPLRGSREPVAGSRRAVLDFRLPATGYRFPLDIHKSNDEKEGFIQRCPGKNPFPIPHSPLPALLR